MAESAGARAGIDGQSGEDGTSGLYTLNLDAKHLSWGTTMGALVTINLDFVEQDGRRPLQSLLTESNLPCAFVVQDVGTDVALLQALTKSPCMGEIIFVSTDTTRRFESGRASNTACGSGDVSPVDFEQGFTAALSDKCRPRTVYFILTHVPTSFETFKSVRAMEHELCEQIRRVQESVNIHDSTLHVVVTEEFMTRVPASPTFDRSLAGSSAKGATWPWEMGHFARGRHILTRLLWDRPGLKVSYWATAAALGEHLFGLLHRSTTARKFTMEVNSGEYYTIHNVVHTSSELTVRRNSASVGGLPEFDFVIQPSLASHVIGCMYILLQRKTAPLSSYTCSSSEEEEVDTPQPPGILHITCRSEGKVCSTAETLVMTGEELPLGGARAFSNPPPF